MPVGFANYQNLWNMCRYFIVIFFKAYHSRLSSQLKIANMAVLPLRTQFRGPAPKETNRKRISKFLNDNKISLRDI